MKIAVVPIGNSKGIRIPKIILKQCHIEKNVDLEVKGENIIVRPFKKEPRRGWDEAFKKMYENNDDKLLIDDNIDLNIESWEW